MPEILFVAQLDPWPPVTGARLRVTAMVRALTRIGDVDCICLLNPANSRTMTLDDIADVGLRRMNQYTKPPPDRSKSLGQILKRLTSLRPASMAVRDHEVLAEQVLRDLGTRHYDLVWFSREETLMSLALDRAIADRVIVDVDDLEESKLTDLAEPTGSWIRRAAVRASRERERWLWHRVHRDAGRGADLALVCSSQDADRLRRVGVPNVAVVPNGYHDRALLPDVETTTPRILLQGSLVYRPNVDAAVELVDQILPAVRELAPGATVDLVGQPGPGIAELGHRDGVTVHGRVEAMEPHLEVASVCVVPLRRGSGTRIKILESFAAGIPVVCTAKAAEGIDFTDGTHLLLADDPQSFAEQIVRLHTDRDLRHQIRSSARAMFEDRYRWSSIEDEVERHCRELLGSGAMP